MKRSKSSPVFAIASIILTAGLTGCFGGDSKSNNPSPGREAALYELNETGAVIDNIGRNVILETYIDLDTQIRALVGACERLNAVRTPENLKAAQNAWKAARVPWESTESFLIGPVTDLGIDPKLDTWPLATKDLRDVLASNQNVTKDTVRALGLNLQGFHTAEYLLFGEGVTSNDKNITAFTEAEFQYLIAVTEVMAEYTGQLVTTWRDHSNLENADSPAFVDVFTLKAPSQRTGYSNRAQVLQTIINDGMIRISDEVGNGKLGVPLGGSIDAANSALVESQFSWNSLTDFQNNIESMVHLYTGDYKNQGLGIDALVKKVNPALDARIRAQLAAAKKSVADIAGPEGLPFTRAIKDPEARVRITAAMEELSTLHAMFKNELLPLAN